ncbi:MAG: glycoside hydrolase family 3 C-terminal domain-containing protein, partial [Bifidobacteriaceae bacterium]|nr:glycoside hydrolase family 3 C-terminal domain-containing protein [Bifidobacteriaceae bacterium]
EVPLHRGSVAPVAPTDTAIYVIARNSGEFADRNAVAGDYYLNATELGNLQMLGEAYKNVVVVINSGGIIDTSFFKTINAAYTDPQGGPALDSLFLLSQAGQEGGHALVDVLSGKVSPSGKLTDTWASKYDYYPASATFGNRDGNALQENYVEGIYVGYRYFDSFYKSINPSNPASVVNYPFGHGLSYTDFDIAVNSFSADMNKVTITVTVTNVGNTYSGKEVVQVYFSAPPSLAVDKPYQELAAYGKTDTLAPGASQTLTITSDTAEMASYNAGTASATSTYNVLDAGEYRIRVGNSSRGTAIAGVIGVSNSVNAEQLSHQITDQSNANEWVSNRADFYTYPGEHAEYRAADFVELKTAGYTTVDSRSPYSQDVAITNSSVYYAMDGNRIAKTTAYLDPAVTDWEGTGAPYVAKSTEGETAQVLGAPVDQTKTLFDVARGTYPMNEFVAGLTVTQLANLVEGARINTATLTPTARGAAGYTTALYQDKGIPVAVMPDGPAGLRVTAAYPTTNPTEFQYATAWPIGTMLAQTFNLDLIEEVGTAIGDEMVKFGATWWLAPGLNIHRDPLCGRNFEYYSEDPLVSGLIAAATTRGVQSRPGVGVTLKHYFGNNQETSRTTSNDTINERAMREIYLKGFEIAVKATQPMAIMSSYNKVNGTYVAGDYDSLFDILRGEWGFKGLVMTDWGGVRAGIVNCMYAGNDLIMPGNNANQVIQATKPTQATIGANGLIAYTTSTYIGVTTYAWSTGSLVLSATGASTITTPITAAPTGFTSVDAAYRDVVAALADPENGLTAAQKAAITVTVDEGDPATAVTKYTVSVKGDYKASMRLGDLQRSAANILTVLTHTLPFAQLAAVKSEPGISVGSYTAMFSDLPEYVVSTSGAVTPGSTAAHLRLLRLELSHYAPVIADAAAYTAASFAPFKAAYDAASALAADPTTSPDQASAAGTAMTTAFAALAPVVDTTLL